MAHVLVIDDDPLFREIAQEMLVQVGHTVTLANDGGKAALLPATASEVPHVFVWAKSPPASMSDSVSVAVPLLVSVMV